MDPETTQSTQNTLVNWKNLVLFRLDQQIYALPIEPILQIIEMVKVTPVPQVNGSMEGVINYHGSAVSIVNLRKHLGLPFQSQNLHTPIIMVAISGHTVGLIVDEVLEVLNISGHQIVHPQEILLDGMEEIPLLRGIVKDGEKIAMLLDIDNLFAARQTRALAEVTAALQAEIEPKLAQNGAEQDKLSGNGAPACDLNQPMIVAPATQLGAPSNDDGSKVEEKTLAAGVTETQIDAPLVQNDGEKKPVSKSKTTPRKRKKTAPQQSLEKNPSAELPPHPDQKEVHR